MPIDRAFESQLSQNYFSFILAMGYIGVSISHTDNGIYKIFDSRARDESCRGHLLGTCVLLEVPSIQSLLQYFRAILSIADNFELKGMQISTCEITTANSVTSERNCSCKQCCAVVSYVNY